MNSYTWGLWRDKNISNGCHYHNKGDFLNSSKNKLSQTLSKSFQTLHGQ